MPEMTELLAGFKSEHIIGGKLRHVANELYGPDVPIPEFESGQQYRVFLDKDLVNLATRLVNSASAYVGSLGVGPGSASAIQTGSSWEETKNEYKNYLRKTMTHVLSQDGIQWGLSTLAWMAVTKKVVQLMEAKGLTKSPKAIEIIQDAHKAAFEEPADRHTPSLRKQIETVFEDKYNTEMIQNLFENNLVYLPDNLVSTASTGKEKIDNAVRLYLRSTKVFTDDGKIDFTRAGAVSKKLKRYFRKTAATEGKSLFSHATSPTVIGVLLQDPVVSKEVAKLAGVKEGDMDKHRSLVKWYSEHSESLWQRDFVKHFMDKIKLFDQPFETRDEDGVTVREPLDLQFGIGLTAVSAKTAPIIIYDIKDSSEKAKRLGFRYTLLQDRLKTEIHKIFNEHGGKFRNDEGDSQFFSTETAGNAVLAAHKLMTRTDALNKEASQSLNKRKGAIEGRLVDLDKEMEDLKKEISRLEGRRSREGTLDSHSEKMLSGHNENYAAHLREFTELRTEDEEIEGVLKELPQVRVTIAYGKFLLPRDPHGTPMGETINQGFRISKSWGSPSKERKVRVDISRVEGAPRILHDGIVTAKELYKALRTEEKQGLFKIEEDPALTEAMKVKGMFFDHPGLDPAKAEAESRTYGINGPKGYVIRYATGEAIPILYRGRIDTAKNYLTEPVFHVPLKDEENAIRSP